MKTNCSICSASIESEDSAILTMGGFATPRYICTECEGDIDAASYAKDAESANEAIDRVSKKMTENNVGDEAVLKTVREIMTAAAARAEQIKSGDYDFSEENEQTLDGDDEVPEELRETEEDKALDRKEAEANKRTDKIINWASAIILAAAVGFFIYRIITTYFL